MFLKGGNSLKNEDDLELGIDGGYLDLKLEYRHLIFNVVTRGRHLYVAMYTF
jgi:hypothetical protein